MGDGADGAGIVVSAFGLTLILDGTNARASRRRLARTLLGKGIRGAEGAAIPCD